MATANETTVHLPEQNIDVTLRVDYMDHVAVVNAGLEKLDELQFDASTLDDKDEKGKAVKKAAVPFGYTIARKAAMLTAIPKSWTWKNADGSAVPLNASTINRLPIRDAKALADACETLFGAVSAALTNPDDPKGSPSSKQ